MTPDDYDRFIEFKGKCGDSYLINNTQKIILLNFITSKLLVPFPSGKRQRILQFFSNQMRLILFGMESKSNFPVTFTLH